MKSITQQRMAGIFNEWARRYASDQNLFDNLLDDEGNPIEDYGDRCSLYFTQIAKEMDENNLLPKNT